MFWIHRIVRHRRSTEFLSEDKSFVKVVHDGKNIFYKQTKICNKHVQVEARSLGKFNSNIEVDVVRDRCKVYCDTPHRPTRSIRYNIERVENTNGTTEWKISSRR